MAATPCTPPRPSVWGQALDLADRTPAERNRTVDFLRALSIFAVVLGHWLVAAPHVVDGELVPGHLLALRPWTQWLTWLFQVMPIFFLVGGYSNGSSWVGAQRKGQTYAAWLRSRIERLVGPVLPVLIVWSGLAFVGRLAGVPSDDVKLASQAALVPVWFLAVYLAIVACVPVTQAAFARFGMRSIGSLVAAAGAVDALTFVFHVPGVRWANYALVWLAIHQLGYAWRAGLFSQRRHALLMSAAGLGALVAAVGFGPYPVAMIGVPGAELSNSTPPNLALLSLGVFQAGFVLAIEPTLARLLARRRLWAGTVLINGMIMSVYLWHMTAMLIAVGVALAAGSPGLALVPGSATWWAARPLWLAAYALPLVLLVAGFLRYERRSASAKTRPVATRRALTGGGLVVAGLALTSAGGVAAGGLTGVRLWVVVQPLIGAALAGFGPLSRRRSEPS